MEKKEDKIQIWIGYEIERPDDWDFTPSNIDNLLFAIKKGKCKTMTPRRIKIESTDPKVAYTHEMT